MMRSSCVLAVATFLVTGLFPLAASIGQVQVPRQPVRGTPIHLFDGKSLEGWEKQNGQPSENWIVQEGAIYRNSNGGDLYHKHWYRDFELSFQWKLSKKGNSGLKYRVQPYGKRFLGCEYQIQDEQVSLFTRHSTGSIYAIFEPNKNKKLNPLGEWNRSKIVVCGNQVEHWLNGEKIVEARFGSSDWLRRVHSSKFNSHPQFAENREGRIFLQDHGNPVWFREIVVVPLDCDHGARCPTGQKRSE